MLQNLEIVTNNLPLVDTDSVLTILPAFTIEVRKVNKVDFQGETFEIGNKEEQEIQRRRQATGGVAASISLPSSLLEGVRDLENGGVAVSSIYHRNTSLFVQEAGEGNVGTSVISATLVNNGTQVSVTNLSSPVVIRFKEVCFVFMVLYL